MSEGNSTTFQNGTTVFDVKNEKIGFNLFHTFFLPFCIIFSLILVSTAVYYVIRKKRLDQLRHRLVPLYHFDPGECEDWEEELLEESKTQITRNPIQYYRSMSSPTMTTEY